MAKKNGTVLVINTCNGAASQRWTVTLRFRGSASRHHPGAGPRG